VERDNASRSNLPLPPSLDALRVLKVGVVVFALHTHLISGIWALAEHCASKATFSNHLKMSCGVAAINDASVRERVSGRGVAAPSRNDMRWKLVWVAYNFSPCHCGLELSKHPSSHPTNTRTHTPPTPSYVCSPSFQQPRCTWDSTREGRCGLPLLWTFVLTHTPPGHCPLFYSLHTTTDICVFLFVFPSFYF
jgi:hypothetical protein